LLVSRTEAIRTAGLISRASGLQGGPATVAEIKVSMKTYGYGGAIDW
jgi:hypothetical protein